MKQFVLLFRHEDANGKVTPEQMQAWMQQQIEGPFGAEKGMLGGFITVKAESVDEAVAFAKGAPILQGEGNTVEVREVYV